VYIRGSRGLRFVLERVLTDNWTQWVSFQLTTMTSSIYFKANLTQDRCLRSPSFDERTLCPVSPRFHTFLLVKD